MGLITTFENGQSWDIRYSKNEQDGFYFTSIKEDIIQNCISFEIDLENDDPLGSPHHLKEFDTFFVYTAQVGGKPFQYIILNGASEGEILDFLEKKPKKIANKIYKRLGLVEE